MTITQQLKGALLVDKPIGISSHDVIRKLKTHFKIKYGLSHRKCPKLGHGGTLDPFASGLLIVLIGAGTRFSRYFLNSEKSYLATMQFGKATQSGDPTTEVAETSTHLPSDIECIKNAANSFTENDYLQKPPMYSAKKHEGKPLYDLARKGKQLERKPVACNIKKLNIIDYHTPNCQFEVTCSGGTYIRTLAEDLAKKCESVAHLTALRRTECCQFNLKHTIQPDIFENDLDNLNIYEHPAYIPLQDLLPHLPDYSIQASDVVPLAHGKKTEIKRIMNNIPDLNSRHVKLVYEKNIVAMAVKDGAKWKLEKVFGDTINRAMLHLD